jgi:hypothetical protein
MKKNNSVMHDRMPSLREIEAAFTNIVIQSFAASTARSRRKFEKEADEIGNWLVSTWAEKMYRRVMRRVSRAVGLPICPDCGGLREDSRN